MSQFITYNKSLSISHLSPIGSISLENLIHLGYVLYVFLPSSKRKRGLFMGLSKESELQNGMGLRNHVIEFFVVVVSFLIPKSRYKGPPRTIQLERTNQKPRFFKN